MHLAIAGLALALLVVSIAAAVLLARRAERRSVNRDHHMEI